MSAASSIVEDMRVAGDNRERKLGSAHGVDPNVMGLSGFGLVRSTAAKNAPSAFGLDAVLTDRLPARGV